MATQSGPPHPPVDPVAAEVSEIERLLREEPYGFEFFQAVRLLGLLFPEKQPVGRFASLRNEVVRFGANSDYTFPASQIARMEWPPDGPPLMRVNFMGLTGPMGLLPLYYSALVRERVRARDTTLRDFFDIFNHRAISLFYQAWEKYRFTIDYERGDEDRFSRYLLDLVGIGTPGLARRQTIPDDALLFYTGLISPQARSATALRQLLMDYFDVPVEIEQFVGAWHPLPADTQCRFSETGAYSEQLGVGAVVGDEVWDQQSGVRIRLGPLNLPQYLDFLPVGAAYEPLRVLTRFFAGDAIDFEVQLVLKREDAPPCKLGEEGAATPRLGWLTWARSSPLSHDPGDTILRL
jgi:type VI secretion system protein ImpH